MTIQSSVQGTCVNVYKSSRPEDTEHRYSIQLMSEPEDKNNSPYELHTFKLPKSVDPIAAVNEYPSQVFKIVLSSYNIDGKSGFYIGSMDDIQLISKGK